MSTNLGKLEQIIDLRSIWKNEATDFTVWLAREENLALLSNTIGMDLTLEERESSVGSFNVDIFAKEEGTDRNVIIENQLEDTNHDHLGKLITYASGKEADVVVWIVKRARDEHRKAIEWLNQHTDDKIGFFLIEIELWKINDSPIAPKFNIVERPNDWAKNMKTIEGLSDAKKLQLEFWTEFYNYANSETEFKRNFSLRKPRAQHWYDLSVGTSAYHIGLTVNTQKKTIGCEIYINEDKEIFENFKQHKQDILNDFGLTLTFKEATKACRIIIVTPIDINNRTNWENAYRSMCDNSLKLKEIISKYDK